MNNPLFKKFPDIIYKSSQDGKQLNEILSGTEPEYMVISEKKFKKPNKLKEINNKEALGKAIKIVKYPPLRVMYWNYLKRIFAV